MWKVIYYGFLFFFLFAEKTSLAEKAGMDLMLSQYQSLHPFYNSIREPMPVQKCEKISGRQRTRQPKEHCWIEIQYEENPEQMFDLLEQTEKSYPVSDPDFLLTDLGKEYLNLQRFMNIYEQAVSCKKNLDDTEFVDSHLKRIEWNLSAVFNEQEACSPLSEDIPGVLENKSLPFEESDFQRLLFLDIVNKSVKARLSMEHQTQKTSKEDSELIDQIVHGVCQGTMKIPYHTLRGNRYRGEKVCTQEDKEFLAKTIEEIKKETPLPEEKINVQQRVNTELQEINSILQEYNEERSVIVARNQEALSKLPSDITRRPSVYKIKTKEKQELNRLKANAFRRYQTKLSEIYSTDIGSFFATSAVQESTGLVNLEELSSKNLGLGGFEKTVLSNTDSFALLKPIDSTTSETAVTEYADRIQSSLQNAFAHNSKQQREEQSYLSQSELPPEKLTDEHREQRMEDIEKLIMTHPGSLSSVLKNHPDYFPIVCSALKNIASDERKRALLKKSLIYLGSAGALTISLIAPIVGISGLPVLLAVAATATTVSTIDYSVRSAEAKRHYELREDMLNAYLGQTGDNKSIEDMRKEWENFMAEDIHSKWAIGLGLFDLTRTGFAVRSSVKITAQSSNLPAKLSNNRQLLKAISDNSEYKQAFIQLAKNHPIDKVRRFLSTISFFPKLRQQVILDNLSKIVLNPELNLDVLTSALKSSARISGIQAVLKRAATCVSCKVTSTTKKVKE